MNKFKKILLALVLFAVAGVAGAALAPTKAVYAAEETTTEAEAETADNTTGSKALAAAIAIGLAGAAGTIGMGMAVAKSTEGISRQPEASGEIRSTLMIGLVFIETAIIYALIVAILVVFVL